MGTRLVLHAFISVGLDVPWVNWNVAMFRPGADRLLFGRHLELVLEITLGVDNLPDGVVEVRLEWLGYSDGSETVYTFLDVATDTVGGLVDLGLKPSSTGTATELIDGHQVTPRQEDIHGRRGHHHFDQTGYAEWGY